MIGHRDRKATDRIALVIGATGGIGSETALALQRRGWRVRALHRQPEEASWRSQRLEPIEWVRGDAMRASDVTAAAAGARLILHAANPPGYKDWPGSVLPMLESSIEAARASGARLILPGTIYNFPPDGVPLLNEDAPQRAVTRKGAIRIAMEARLQREATQGVRSLILRAGDFFGPHTGNSWFSQALVKPGSNLRAVTYPGPAEIGHGWAYLPDVGETLARLADREAELDDFARFHFGGHWLERGIEMAEAVRRVADAPHIPIRTLPWWAIGAGAPFVPQLRELWEMRYLWRVPLRLDNARLVAFLGTEPHTALDEAVRASLEGLGCFTAGRPVLQTS